MVDRPWSDETSDETGRRSPRVVAVSPASPTAPALAEAGAGVLRALGLAVRLPEPRFDAVGPHARSWLAGDDRSRGAALAAALTEDCEAVWMVRGGFGSARAVAAVGLTASRVPLVAFSDGTALLAWASRAGQPAWSGPPLTQLTRLDPASSRRLEAFARQLGASGPPLPEPVTGLTPRQAGAASGPLFPANLTVLASLAGTPLAPDLRGAILALEDTGEPPYRVDRALTQLAQSGLLDGVRGLVIGDFSHGLTASEALSDGLAAVFHHLVAEWAAPRGVPVAAGLPFGHGVANAPLPCGRASGCVAALRVGSEGAALDFLAEGPA